MYLNFDRLTHWRSCRSPELSPFGHIDVNHHSSAQLTAGHSVVCRDSSADTPLTTDTKLPHSDDTLASSATLAPERDHPSSLPCPTPPPSPPHTPPSTPSGVPALSPQLPHPAARRAVEDGDGTAEESTHSSQASADSFGRVMDLLGMGHRLFVPKLLAVRRKGVPGWSNWAFSSSLVFL